jgi:hypothetical protein
MKTTALFCMFLMCTYGASAQLDEDSAIVFLDSVSYVWPCCNDSDTRGWEPKAPDRELAKLIMNIAHEIDVNWEPDFIKVALCVGEACPSVKYFGTAKYLRSDALPQLYMIYHKPGYRSMLRKWGSDTLDFVLKAVVAHEIGHIAHHHPWLYKEPTRDVEDKCDYYTGKVMYNAWKGRYTLEQAVFAIKEIALNEQSRYYYSKARRIEAIKKGYLDALEQHRQGHPSTERSTQYAIESTHRSLYRTMRDIVNYAVWWSTQIVISGCL